MAGREKTKRGRRPPVITRTVVDAVSTLAMDTDATDQAICDTGCLPFLVSLIGDPRCDASLCLAAVHAVMHMARDSRDAKRQLTEEGVVAKMRDIVEAYDPESADSESRGRACGLLPGESRGGHRVLGAG